MATVDKKKKDTRDELWENFVEYAPKLLVASMTGYFTWHAAYKLTENFVMSSMTVLLAEGFWFLWQFLRDENAENDTQTKNADFSWRVSIAFVAITDLASGVFMAHDAGFSAFAIIPDAAQIAPTIAIPFMAIFQGVMLAIYTGNSDSRLEMMNVKKERRAARNALKLANAQAEKAVANGSAERMAQLARQNAPIIGAERADRLWQENYRVMAAETDIATSHATNPTKPERQN